MKKHKFKRLVAACMLGAFSISLGLFGGGTEALASDEQPKTGSITIQNAIEGATYNFYRIADLTLTDSGDPEDGVSYTMSAEQYEKYGYYITPYDSVQEAYDKLKDHPEGWDEDAVGMDYETGLKFHEEVLASPILVNDVEGVDKVAWPFSETYITAFPEIAKQAFESLERKAPDYSYQAANGEVIADDLPLGYYIIIIEGKQEIAEDAIIPINLTNVTTDRIVKSKASPVSITKTADITNASVGDIVTFTIKGVIPSYNAKYIGANSLVNAKYTRMYIGDTMENMILTGVFTLKINGEIIDSEELLSQDEISLEEYKTDYQAQPEDFEAITIHGNNEKAKEYLLDVSWPILGESAFCFGFDVYKEYYNKPFEFTYSAVVTDEAIRGSEGNDNGAMALFFDWTPALTGLEITTTEDQETVYTYDINILKYADGDTSKVLPGAQFALYKQNEDGNKLYYKLTEDATLVEGKDLKGPKVTWVDIGDKTINQAIADGDITAVTSGQDGKAAFKGISHDTYYLQEVKAPDGYNLMSEDTVVELGVDAPADFEVQVENTGGALLPETGGPGTALFTMMGLLLMAGAATVYLTQRQHHQS